MKKLIEWQKRVDVSVIRNNLVDLSELNRVLSSGLCRRKSILTLLDDFGNSSCLEYEAKCDNCRLFFEPSTRDVTNEVLTIMNYLKFLPTLNTFTLRGLLAGINHGFSFPNNDLVEGLLRKWPTDEIAQFTDFLLNERFIVKKGFLLNDVPSHFLTIGLLPKGKVLFPVHEVPVIPSFIEKKSVKRLRHHEIQKRRFFPKVMSKT